MYKLSDLAVGMRVTIEELNNIYDIVIILTDIQGTSYKDKTGRIVYIGEPDTEELQEAFDSTVKDVCTIYNLHEDVEGSYSE